MNRDDFRLTRNFVLRETSVSASHPALAVPMPNIFGEEAVKLAFTCLQPCRTHIGQPFKVLSWWRSTALNAAVGGSATSQHLRAQAADITLGRLRRLFMDLLDGELEIECGQVIYYPDQNFIHLALPSSRYPAPSFHVHSKPRGLAYAKVESLDAFRNLV